MLHIYLSVYYFTYLSVYLSVYLDLTVSCSSIYSSIYSWIYSSIYLSINLFIYHLCLSIHSSVYLSIYLAIHLSIYSITICIERWVLTPQSCTVLADEKNEKKKEWQKNTRNGKISLRLAFREVVSADEELLRLLGKANYRFLTLRSPSPLRLLYDCTASGTHHSDL